MNRNLTKRILSLILSLTLLLSSIPISVLAAEDPETVTPTVEEETLPAETGEPEVPVPAETTVAAEEVPEETQLTDTHLMGASNVVDSGAWDTTIDWSVSSDGTLTISGRGRVLPQQGITSYPWDKYNDEIKSLVIAEGITFVQIGIFHLRAVTHLSLPESMTGMAHTGFYFMEKLKTVSIPSGNPAFCVKDNVVFTKDMSTLIAYPTEKPGTAYRVPDSVTKIEDSSAFSNSQNLVELTIPASVRSIEHYAISECPNLKRIIFEGDVPELGYYVFYDLDATICYPAGNPTWTAEVMNEDYGGTLTWEAYDSSEPEAAASGKCGDNLTWTLSSDGLLKISGTGRMWEFAEVYDASWTASTAPWLEYNRETPILDVALEEGVTSIGSGAFSELSDLGTILIPGSVTEIGGRAFAQSGKLTNVTIPGTVSSIGKYAFAYCGGITEAAIPDGVACIQTGTFMGCSNLAGISLPRTVTKVDIGAFMECAALKTVYFDGSEAQWSAIEVQQGNSPLLNASVVFGGLPADVPEYHNTLAELTKVDYLAFSQIAYEDFVEGETVQESLTRTKGNKWDNVWNDNDITYAELCEGIARWKVCYIQVDWGNGFYAVAFRNDSGEAVLAYRGSKPLTNLLEMVTDDQSYKDWVLNDLKMILSNEVSDKNQYDNAIKAYKGTKNVNGIHTIVTTGHSLGGLWGEIASAYSGCKAITFNAISALDIMYVKHPIALGRQFRGIDTWNFTDHINVYDILAGAMEAASSDLGLSIKLKPFVAYSSNYSPTSVINSHSLKSLVRRSGDQLVLNPSVGSWTGNSGVSGHLASTSSFLNIGISGTDYFDNGLKLDVRLSAFGGDGADRIYTSVLNDTLIGGRGNDHLDGGWGDDTYYYFKGDGCDTIVDIGGRDSLRLEGFDSSDRIEMYEDRNSDYITLRCNESTILNIYKKNREYSLATLSSFKVYINGGQENNITEFFSKYLSGCHMLVRCPVSIEILDADGNVVYTLQDSAVGSYYTDYGNFYIFQEEDGSYGKLLDLAEGCSARILGEDTGTMKIEFRNVVDGVLSEDAKVFEDVPVSADFTATLEETMGGELLLAADTDGDGTVDAKIGYDGTPIPVESIQPAEEYIVLKPRRQTQLHALVKPMELAPLQYWVVEEGSESVIDVSPDGTVTGLQVGTGYALAVLESGGVRKTARCRVDVAQTQFVPEEQTGLPVEAVKIQGVQLGTTALTTELFRNDYADFEILLQLPQNNPAAMTRGRRGGGIAMEDARFTDEAMAKHFGLVVLDDRRVVIIPTDEAVTNPKAVKDKYTGTVTVTIQGKEYETESLTLNVRKTIPKLKATIPAFNSFYSGQSQKPVITGGTAAEIEAVALPEWLTLKGETLSLNEKAPTKSASGKASLKVYTEEWSIPVTVSLTVKNTYKAPGLKLSASSVTLAKTDSIGAVLKLVPSGKKDTLTSLNVSGITAPEGYTISGFDATTGEFTLKGNTPGKITLNVSFHNTDKTVPLTLTVKTADVKLKLSKTSITLNKKVADSAQITVSATPADFALNLTDYRLTDSKGVDKKASGELTVRLNGNKITIATNAVTPANATYKLYFSAGGSKEVMLTIKTIEKEPTVTFQAKGNLDLSFPKNEVTITPAFKNYSGGFTFDKVETENYTLVQNGNTIIARYKEDAKAGTYTQKLILTLDDGSTVENTVKITVKRTAVKLKLSASKLTLNKLVRDIGEIGVSCTTKGYDFTKPVWALMDKSGKNPADGELNINWQNGKLVIGTNDNTDYGATYKLLVRATEADSAVTLTITIPAENKSAVTATIKAKGSIDVIRDGSAITLTPAYKNVTAQTVKEAKLVFTKTANKVTTNADELFRYTANADGTFTITKAEGAKLDHSAKYTVQLVATVNAQSVTVKPVALSVKQGSAKLTLTTLKGTMFAMDNQSRSEFTIIAADATLNEIAKVETKDAKYVDLFEIFDYEDGTYAIGYKDNKVPAALVGKTVTLNLNVFLKGNETSKANTTVKLKLTILE